MSWSLCKGILSEASGASPEMWNSSVPGSYSVCSVSSYMIKVCFYLSLGESNLSVHQEMNG